MSIYHILNIIQKNIHSPKNQKNNFGNYSYRSAEDIMNAVKPLVPEGTTLFLSEDLVLIGDRFYIKSTATLQNESGTISNTAWARESLDKKGMDPAQITGASTSYARKYALQGLFLLDNNKDPDSYEVDSFMEKAQEYLDIMNTGIELPSHKKDVFCALFYKKYSKALLHKDLTKELLERILKI